MVFSEVRFHSSESKYQRYRSEELKNRHFFINIRNQFGVFGRCSLCVYYRSSMLILDAR